MMDDAFKDKEVNPLAMMEVGEREEEDNPPNVQEEMEMEKEEGGVDASK
jgi:hypothetical protein